MNQSSFFVFIVLPIFWWGCQLKPTKVIELSADVFSDEVVLIDTRSPLEFESFHITGTQNLWWEDFVILKDAKNKKREFDPDLSQTIERLSKKGIHPSRKVYLIGSSDQSIENKKWHWLLQKLEIKSFALVSIEEFRKDKKGRWAQPTIQDSWVLSNHDDFLKKEVLDRAAQCFLSWNDKICR